MARREATSAGLALWPVAALLAAGLFLLEMGWTLWTDHREIRGRLPTGT